MLLPRPVDRSHTSFPHSPDLRFFCKETEVRNSTASLRQSVGRGLRVLNVGGRHGEQNHWFPEDSTVVVLDLPGSSRIANSITGDICAEAIAVEDEYDVVFSHEVFEHLYRPWIAARHCLRLCRPGGLNIHIAPFSWRYHPVPLDCFRYSHSGFESLFQQLGEVDILVSGYDITDRRGGAATQHGFWDNGRDHPPADQVGGWLENWDTILIVRRPTA